MSRNEQGLREALRKIPELREEFWRDVRVPGDEEDYNQSLERAGRVADFLDFAVLLCSDALERDESAGAHFREEHQTPDGEALRDDESHSAVFAWEFQGDGQPPKLHREQLHFETVHLAQRSYKWLHFPSFRAKSRNPGAKPIDISAGSFDSAALRSG